LFQATPLETKDKPADSLQVLEITPRYELAPNGLNFSFYLGGLHSAYVRGQCSSPRTAIRKPPPSFGGFSIIPVSLARIPSVHWRTCNSAEYSLCQEIRSGPK